MIRFLIIVPTLNSYSLLPHLVHSLLQQTYPHWRVEFIDGPSEQKHRDWLDDICNQDSRFNWQQQVPTESGIFAAMNQGINFSDRTNDWILFWGSDDQAASPLVLGSAAKRLEVYKKKDILPDLLVCDGTYYHRDTTGEAEDKLSFGRKTKFTYHHSYRRSLFLGSTPPHQATFFSPNALATLSKFETDLKLSADLDYFLKLSNHVKITVFVEDLEIVWIGDSGVSKQETKRRLIEVRIAYKRAFGDQWWIPFSLRYLQRIQSLVKSQ